MRWYCDTATVILALLVAVLAFPAQARQVYGPPATVPARDPALPMIDGIPSPRVLGGDGAATSLNPLAILESAAAALPGSAGSTPGESVPGAGSSGRPGGLSAAVNIMVVLTVLALAPSIMLMTTCFMRIIIVLGMLKQAMGTQSIPPPQVTIALSLFMTLLVMSPTIDRINAEAITPYRQGEISTYDELWEKARQPVRDFMFDQIEATGNWSSLYMVLNYRGIDTSRPEAITRADVDMISLIPAFMLSELKVAFLMGFRVYLPFLVIDMVISSLLISMSMMMLPPVMVSLPFKILLFILVDGWQLIVGSLMTSFARPSVLASAAGGFGLPGFA